jgi:hypothetical protein
MTDNQARYGEQAEHELRLAGRAHSTELRKLHLNRAAEYATLAELAGRGASMTGCPEAVPPPIAAELSLR